MTPHAVGVLSLRKAAVLLLGIMPYLSAPVLALQVTLAGEVRKEGSFNLDWGSRINDLLEKHPVDEDAFYLGASWQRLKEQPAQLKLQKGLLFDLKTLQQQALLDNRPELAKLAQQWQSQLAALPVTGRIRHVMDPAALLATNINHRLEDGDRLVYPPRPANVRVMGAVTQPCTVPFTALQTARHYLALCAAHALADKNHLLLIQPDGAIFHEGIALWNRGKETPVAPGAIVFVPINTDYLDDNHRQLNRDMATFLATQETVSDTP